MQKTVQYQGDPPTVASSGGYWSAPQVLTTLPLTLAVNGRSPDAIATDTDALQLTGVRGAEGVGGTATQCYPMAANVNHAMSFYSITAASNTAAKVWAIWYNNPNINT